MSETNDYLFKQLNNEFGERNILKKGLPVIIGNNLNPSFPLRVYQIKAFQYFMTYWTEQFEFKPNQHQLLFQMATGSGKTIIMAGIILYLYEQGYRNFLFFVNSTNVIEKTKDNFLNTDSIKYLFNSHLYKDERKIVIKGVDNFQIDSKDEIQIVFSTIQGLHSRLNTPKEDNLTYDDFAEKKIALISDEAHHINTITKKDSTLSLFESEEKSSWEGTVQRIFEANDQNVLLEFTATAELENPLIYDKYRDKLIYDYPLKQFRVDGYSKEIKVIQADFEHWDRTLIALLMSQYRRKIFEKNKKRIKPVILLKSETIEKSKLFYQEFLKNIKNMRVVELEQLRVKADNLYGWEYDIFKNDTNKALFNAFNYFDSNKITLENLLEEMKNDFSEEKCLIVNSKDESEVKQIVVNTLENDNNEYRVIFTVNMLNEGWDVLNLFDIVRLFDKRDARKGIPGKTTMSEAQLIGRGARYCPFQITQDQPLFQRKYDDDIENELRICEELYYHSSYNPRYISELNDALIKTGIKASLSIEREVKLKDEFKDTELYKNGIIYLNERIKNDNFDVFEINNQILEERIRIHLKTGYITTSLAMVKIDMAGKDESEKDFRLIEFGKHIILKAINKLPFYEFCNLKIHYGNLKSIKEFVSSDLYLGKVKVEVFGNKDQIRDMDNEQKLKIAVDTLNQLSIRLKEGYFEFKGTTKFKPSSLKGVLYDKTLNFTLNESDDKESGNSIMNPVYTKFFIDISKKDWFVFTDNFGTSEEKRLIKFVDKTYDKLKEKWDDIYLIRNERYVRIYDFDDGKPIEPDFILYLFNNKLNAQLYYQIFIEPKGNHLLKTDEWKEKFLLKLKEEHQIEQVWKDKKYIIWGMPFYNEDNRIREFEEAFEKLNDNL